MRQNRVLASGKAGRGQPVSKGLVNSGLVLASCRRGIIGTGQVDLSLDDEGVLDPVAGTFTRIDLVVAVQVQPGAEAHHQGSIHGRIDQGGGTDCTGKGGQWCRTIVAHGCGRIHRRHGLPGLYIAGNIIEIDE